MTSRKFWLFLTPQRHVFSVTTESLIPPPPKGRDVIFGRLLGSILSYLKIFQILKKNRIHENVGKSD